MTRIGKPLKIVRAVPFTQPKRVETPAPAPAPEKELVKVY